MFKPTAILTTDFYKIGHVFQYPKGTNLVYSNFTPRDDKLTICKDSPFYDNKMVVFGIKYFIQHFIIDQFQETFFNVNIIILLFRYRYLIDNALGKDCITLNHIKALHNLGYLPIKIKALAEGSRVPMKTPILTIVNTLPEFYWVPNFLETALSASLWKLCNNATIAYEYKRILTYYANLTCENNSHVQFQAHDFSMRGMSCIEDATISGMAHLTSFVGTDTIPAIEASQYYYRADWEEGIIGCSVPATEHSVMCSQGKDTEIETFKRLITEVYPTGIVSIVSDTWDFWKVITEYLPQLKDIILNRNGKVVIRPDSGDPVQIVCGFQITKYNYAYGGDLCNNDETCDILDNPHKYTFFDKENNKYFQMENVKIEHEYQYSSVAAIDEKELTIFQVKGTIECLWNIFGGTINSKGYKVLNPKIGLIYGDSITIARANEICKRLEEKGFASSNIIFGTGSYTYNYSTRDCFGMAMKATYIEVNNEGRKIFKCPATDSGSKKSAKGLIKVNEDFSIKDQCSWEEESQGLLQTVFEDGKLLIDTTLTEIRNRL